MRPCAAYSECVAQSFIRSRQLRATCRSNCEDAFFFNSVVCQPPAAPDCMHATRLQSAWVCKLRKLRGPGGAPLPPCHPGVRSHMHGPYMAAQVALRVHSDIRFLDARHFPSSCWQLPAEWIRKGRHVGNFGRVDTQRCVLVTAGTVLVTKEIYKIRKISVLGTDLNEAL